MGRLLRPATLLLERLRYAHKILLIALVIPLPLGLATQTRTNADKTKSTAEELSRTSTHLNEMVGNFQA